MRKGSLGVGRKEEEGVGETGHNVNEIECFYFASELLPTAGSSLPDLGAVYSF